MLLPSAFSCDQNGVHSSQKPQRPKLPSFAPLEVPSSPRSGPAGLFASCRALHSILGGPVQSLQSPRLDSVTIRSTRRTNPFDTKHQLQSPPRIVANPRGANKRRREEFEEDLHNPSQNESDGAESAAEEYDIYQTPKRRRRLPVDLPLGLNASDFESLNTPSFPQQTSRRRRRRTLDEEPIDVPSNSLDPAPAPSSPHPSHDPQSPPPDPSSACWSPEDDRRLISVVLSKLNLSSRDWNDCARQLGKDKDSLGRRWKMLVGDFHLGENDSPDSNSGVHHNISNVRLRRGSGRMERTGLDAESW